MVSGIGRIERRKCGRFEALPDKDSAWESLALN